MEKKEFIKKMIEYNYTDEEIKDTLKLVEETKKKYGIEMPYEMIALQTIYDK